MPEDLFWDNENEDRIGITLLSYHKFNFEALIEDYCIDNGLGNFSRFKKTAKKPTSKDDGFKTSQEVGNLESKITASKNPEKKSKLP